MGFIVPSAMDSQREDQPMPYEWFVGIDWGSKQHQVCVLGRDRRRVGERAVDQDGASLARLAEWLWSVSAGQPQRVAVAIEVPRGAIVEGLLERGFHLFAINPKQLDRFRDRHSVAGAKDDRRDAFVLADSVCTDQPSFRRLQLEKPQLLVLRELSRAEETLLEEFRRSANRLRDQLHRFYPQMLELCSAADEPWLWDLIDLAPTPAHAVLLSEEQVQRVLKMHRIRRLTAPEGWRAYRRPLYPWPLARLKPLRPIVSSCCRVCACWPSNFRPVADKSVPCCAPWLRRRARKRPHFVHLRFTCSLNVDGHFVWIQRVQQGRVDRLEQRSFFLSSRRTVLVLMWSDRAVSRTPLAFRLMSMMRSLTSGKQPRLQ